MDGTARAGSGGDAEPSGERAEATDSEELEAPLPRDLEVLLAQLRRLAPGD